MVTFQLRPSESYWSVYRLEFFKAERHVALSKLKQHLTKNDILAVSSSGKFLVLNVGLIEKIKFRSQTDCSNRSLTVCSRSTPDNPSHAGVEGYTNYDHFVALALSFLLIEEGEVVPTG